MIELRPAFKKLVVLLGLTMFALGCTLLAYVTKTDASIRCYPGIPPSDACLNARRAFYIFSGSSVVMWGAVAWTVRRAYA